jgi:hypothetical protein
MRRYLLLMPAVGLLAVLFAPQPFARAAAPDDEVAAFDAYRKVVADTAAMVADADAQALARKHGLQILNVTWEDTGRFKNSAVGPNISDMTIQVQQLDPRSEKAFLTCMPVIRFPNFQDKTGDVRPYKFNLLVGNEKGGKTRPVTLADFLGDLRSYLHDPRSWKGDERSMLASRDAHVLVSAQACFLPIPKQGKAEFNPVVFNYQSYEKHPAVLTIMVTREGTSVTVIDNKRDAFLTGQTWGQRLFFNKAGKRASLTGTRLSEFIQPRPTDPQQQPSVKLADAGGLNMVLLIQVPLKHEPMLLGFAGAAADEGAAPPGAVQKGAARGSDVENAVIGHGRVEGPFTEIDHLKIERDPKFPVRVTVQFYKATSNGVVSEQDMAEITAQIDRVYKEADYVGSLVTQGDTGRPTEYEGNKQQPPGWWTAFWERNQKNTGMTPQEAIAMLQQLYGPNWLPRNDAQRDAALETVSRK